MLTHMPNPRLTQIVAELPFERKMVGIGSLLMVLSLFFPWYQDLDSFRTGDTFTGLTGPMYLAGFTFLVIASLSLLFIVMDYLDRKVPLFKVKTSKFHLWSGIFAFYNLFLVGSVYFHPAFGVNITLKQSGFGMFIAYAAAALITAGGYLEGRGKAAVKEFEKETREPAPQTSRADESKPVIEGKVVHPMIERKPREIHRPVSPQKTTSNQPAMDLGAEENIAPVAAAPQPSPAPVQEERERNVQPFRMDL
jgi:hypothetical protein